MFASQEMALLANRLILKGFTVASAESCTGGLFAVRLTDIPGSSRYFRGGLVVYDDDLKARLLNVPEPLIHREGAVSQAVVEAMLAGLQRQIQSDTAVAISGIAGPDGGTESKPVGTVWIAVRVADAIQSRQYHFAGDRGTVREAAVEAACQQLLDNLPD